MIELGKESPTDLTYDEAYMYCFWQEPVGHWRLPTDKEYYYKIFDKHRIEKPYWFEDRDLMSEKIYMQPAKMTAMPVRTINV